MKVLWLTNVPIGQHKQLLGTTDAQSGGWMETTYTELKSLSEIELGICTLYSGKEIKKITEGNNVFYLIPGYKNIWSTVIDEFKPDIIQLWGTESSTGLDIIRCCGTTPIVVYIQGVMSQIFNHQFDGISWSEKRKFATLKDWIKRRGNWVDIKSQRSVIEAERKIVHHASGIIVESDWCADNYSVINPNVKRFYSRLPINPIYSLCDWDLEQVEKYSIFTNAGGYSVKGHHILFKALSIVKRKYPHVKLRIPGDLGYTQVNNVIYNAYSKYLTSIIEENELSNNIEYVGKLSPEGMCRMMMRSNIFVMPSLIENHSSSLIEAMLMGMPTISSFVGGIQEYYRHNENGLFYRATEHEILAANILRLFDDEGLSCRLSRAARMSTRSDRLSINLKEDYLNIYNRILRRQ